MGMDFVLLAVLSILAAIGFNATYPKLLASPRTAKLQTSYAGKTALTALAFLGVIIVASVLMGVVGEKPALPSA